MGHFYPVALSTYSALQKDSLKPTNFECIVVFAKDFFVIG